MWSSYPRPCAGYVILNSPLRLVLFRTHDRRIAIAVAELDSERLVLEVSKVQNEAPQSGSCGRALGGIGVDVRGGSLRDREPHCHVLFCGIAVGQRNRPPLRLNGGEKLRAAPTLQHSGKLPSHVHGVANSGVHAITARRNELMRRIPGQPDASGTEVIGNDKMRAPGIGLFDFAWKVNAKRLEQKPFWFDAFRVNARRNQIVQRVNFLIVLCDQSAADGRLIMPSLAET